VVKGATITLNKRQRTEQKLQLDFLVISDVGGMYDVLIGKEMQHLTHGMTDHHVQMFEYKCGYEQGECTGLVGSIPVTTEKHDPAVSCVSVAAVQVLHQQENEQVHTSAAFRLGSYTFSSWLLWIVFAPVLWTCQLAAKWVAPASAPHHEWWWPGSKLGARKRVQAHRRSEANRCRQHNTSMDAGMRKWAASQGYSWSRKVVTAVIMLVAVMAMGPGLSSAMHVQYRHAGPGEVAAPVWARADTSANHVASQVLLAQALASPDGQCFRGSGGELRGA
jgi:hypothetical protein